MQDVERVPICQRVNQQRQEVPTGLLGYPKSGPLGKSPICSQFATCPGVALIGSACCETCTQDLDLSLLLKSA